MNIMKYVMKDIRGQKFGRLTALEPLKERHKRGEVVWRCICECGTFTEVRGGPLRCGNTRSCGCFRYKHGESLQYSSKLYRNGTPLYRKWINMRRRCYSLKSTQYEWYGEKGISVCDEWLNDFISFRDWANANGYKKGLSIHRENRDGDYEPSNCEFITKSEHAKITRRESR